MSCYVGPEARTAIDGTKREKGSVARETSPRSDA